ncbi:MAG: transporter [Pseudomonadota bacterium]|nr:transporter [Pseudomonadota bacterium]
MKSGLALSRRARTTWVAVAAAATSGAGWAAGDFEPVTPYRPSVSSPAQLPAPGQLELEFGGIRQRGDAATRASLPYLFKLAFDRDWGVLLGGEARVWQRTADGRASGAGDTWVTLKRAWVLDEATAWGMELALKWPTARDPIGSGRADQSLNAIFSHDFGPVHLDANCNVLRFGQVDPGTGRFQRGASASFSTALGDHWGVTGELSGTQRTGAPSEGQLLGALTWSPTRYLTIDIGVARLARPVPGATSVFAGVVLPLARLW